MKKLLYIFLGIVLLFVACEDRDDNINAVNIRIKNEASFTFIRVQVGDDEKIHENIAPGDYSGYLEYETAYEYAYVQIEADSTSHTYQPIDFVGEDSLNFGFYTYKLHVSQDGDVSLVFAVD